MDNTLQLLQRSLTKDKQKGFLRLLSLLSHSTGMAFLTQGRCLTPFAHMARSDREKIIIHWQQSRFHFFRSLYISLASLTWANTYARPEASTTLHRAIGYPTFDPMRSLPDYQPVRHHPRLPMVSSPNELPDDGFDVIVIGSGAGGGVVAAQVALAGYSVLVIEKGPYYHESEFVLQEGMAAQRNMERGGSFLSEDGTMAFMAGSLIGGGTSINYSASLQLPHYVRSEWAKLGLPYFISKEFVNNNTRVCERIGVTTQGIKLHGSNQVLMKGCEKLGYHAELIPQNSGGHPHECHWCSTGCRDGIKNGSMNTWLRDVVANGGKIMNKTTVRRVMIDDRTGKATGVVIAHHDDDSERIIHAKKVVVSGSSLHSPGILLRSGLKNKHIGEHLHVHSCIATFGYFEHVIDTHKGTMMTAYSDVVANTPENDHYGAKIEGVSHHVGMVANANPWHGSLDHKRAMLRWRYSTSLLTVVREKDSYGKVFYDGVHHDQVKVNYKMSKHDRRSTVAGIVASANILVAAGAREIRTMQHVVPPFIFAEDEEVSPDHPRFIRWLKEQVIPAGAPAIVSNPHQMGTCRMGPSPRVSVVKPTGETWEVNGLYVADASVFPTGSGVNPMITIMSTCLHIADQLLISLRSSSKL
ncbi:uncharacterized protein BX664DRAFT_331992 [Halteromyces radiatus]|uniref:uncharacterized protein n=1 Tax=Halteromyces radiatus TaxID=101107 RepID=UPI00221E4E0D|nr:uncharacterized protein BX664DRAFT_331992 [Halteromyces radiatus]KAI8089029.1 hypothetical protein BX664DRAFT_331992 [Halteromyces radiatus]